MPSSRQLGAIMFTDIVGYTALMADGEQKSIRTFKKELTAVVRVFMNQYDCRSGSWGDKEPGHSE